MLVEASWIDLGRLFVWRNAQEEGTPSERKLTADIEDSHLLAVGLSNNTICIWDLLNSAIIYNLECSGKQPF
jgi:hypothetical protein